MTQSSTPIPPTNKTVEFTRLELIAAYAAVNAVADSAPFGPPEPLRDVRDKLHIAVEED